jgi:hypothetical protein
VRGDGTSSRRESGRGGGDSKDRGRDEDAKPDRDRGRERERDRGSGRDTERGKERDREQERERERQDRGKAAPAAAEAPRRTASGVDARPAAANGSGAPGTQQRGAAAAAAPPQRRPAQAQALPLPLPLPPPPADGGHELSASGITRGWIVDKMPCCHDEAKEEWFYEDPYGEERGPFCIAQLRQWAAAMRQSTAAGQSAPKDYEDYLGVLAFSAAMRGERRCMRLRTLLQLNEPRGGRPPGRPVFRP